MNTRAVSRFTAALGAAMCILGSVMVTSVAAADELVDEKSLSLFQQMSETLGQAPTLRFTAQTLFDHVEPSGVKTKHGMVQEITIMRPDRLHFRTQPEGGPVRMGWYDGKTLTIAVPARQIYAQVDAPDTLDELLDLLQDRYSVQLPVVDLLYSDFFGKIESHVLSGVLLGETAIDGRPQQHLSFETTPGDLQLWIDRSEVAPVPRRMVVTLVALENEPEVLMHFGDWVLGDYVDPSLFEFEPHDSWSKVDLSER